jgi:2-methylcitrate dehydratase PrpD
MGFLQAYSPKQDKDLEYLTSDLGSRWEFLETSLKPFPACRMTHGFIEHAPKLDHRQKGLRAEDVKAITLSLSPNNVGIVGAPIPNKIHPENMVDAQFSAYFTTANSLLYGSDNGVKCYEKARLTDPQIHQLCDKTKCVADSSLKHFGSKLRVDYEDGTSDEVTIPYPLGESQHPFTRDQVDAKYHSLVSPVFGESKARSILDAVNEIEKTTVTELLNLLY